VVWTGTRQRRIPSVPPTIRCGNRNGRTRRGGGCQNIERLALSLLLLKCWACSLPRSSPRFSPHLEPLLSEPSPIMSSLSGSAASDDQVPEGSKEEVEAPETAPSTSRKRGRPKGSHNKSTLEALAAKAAAAASTFVTPQATGAPSGAGVLEKRRPDRPKGSGKKTASAVAAAPSSSRRRGRSPGSKNKKASVVFKVAATPAGPRVAASLPLGPSRPWLEKPALQPPAYLSAQGLSTCIIPALAGSRDLLRLPSQFTDSMEGQQMAYAKLWECSGVQLSYRVKVYYDSQGVCYFRDGWSKFFLDYGAHEGWFILLTRHDRKKTSPSASSMPPSPPVPMPPSREGRGLRRPPTQTSPGQIPCGARARPRKASISRARDSWHS
jgi:hypothetical protein